MAGYVKVWTSLRSNDKYLSLPGLHRGAYHQLLLWCKDQRDDGVITASGWTQVGVELGVDRRTARHICDNLAAKLLLTYDKNAQGIISIYFANYKQWQEITVKEVLKKPRPSVQKCTPLRPDQTRPDQPPIVPLKGDDGIPYQEIINDLNVITGRNFKNVESVRKLIRGRWKEGQRMEDFKYVHRVKYDEWANDPKWRKFLQPSTLYKASKFEGYRNQPMLGDSPLDGLSEKGRATFLAGLRVVQQQDRQREKDEKKRLEIQRDQE